MGTTAGNNFLPVWWGEGANNYNLNIEKKVLEKEMACVLSPLREPS